jgi:4,5-dihydroxyphthalate decarboxylase
MAGLKVAFGAWADATLRARLLGVEFADVKPISRAFAPMVREAAYDLSEMAVATFLMAKASGKPLVLLPAAVFARYQEPALLCRRDDTTIAGPADLRGKRVGIRAYSQTTGLWLRGILRDDFAIAADDIRWTTFEGAHVAEYHDPPFVTRAAPGSDLVTMLREGQLDAIIVGGDMPAGADLRPVFPNLDAAARRFHAAHRFVPVNHLLTVRRDVLERRQQEVAAILKIVSEGRPSGRDALDPAVATAARHCHEQGLTEHTLSLAEIWESLPPSLADAAR